MQEKLQNISPIKQNILHFASTLNMSMREFYAKTGISRGTLESKTGITEDTMAKFIATFPDVSLDWLILNKGDMLKNESTDTTQTGDIKPMLDIIEKMHAEVVDLTKQLSIQTNENEHLHQQNMNLVSENTRLKKDYGDKRNPYSHSVAAEP